MRNHPKVFISYPRRDARDLALRLRDDLKAEDHDAWLDTSEILGGASWAQKIEQAIDRCEVVLALLTKGSFDSPICRAEQLRALRKDKRVIPILGQTDADRPLQLEHLNYRDFSDPSRYNQALQEVLDDISGGGRRELPATHRQTLVTAPALPFQAIPRPEIMDRLRRAVLSDQSESPIAITALRGMGGIGKTVLAKALCEDEIVQAAFPDGVIWVTIGRTPGSLVPQMREIGKALADDVALYDTEPAGTNRLRTLLRDKVALLVLDDVWEKRHVEPFLVEALRCRTLFTTRVGTIGASLAAQDIKLDVMEPQEVRKLLLQWAGKDDVSLDRIAERVGRPPLALKLAGARLREGLSGEEWLRGFQHVAQMKTGRYAHDPHENLEVCFDLSVQALGKEDQRPYFALGIFREPTPEQVVHRLWRWLQPAVSEFDCKELFRELERRVLIDAGENQYFTLHDLLYDYTRGKLNGQLSATHKELLSSYNPDAEPWALAPSP